MDLTAIARRGEVHNALAGGIGWVIAGGESGPGWRPTEEAWLRALRDQCAEWSVPFLLKQLGGWPNKRGHELAVLDGQRYVAMPVAR